jgi:uncharacterized protein YndB with AHSA1/START domain
MTESAATKELVITRVFDAPRELVYRAFIDPDQIAQWFGPVGYSVPRDSIDVDARVGGYQRLVMVNDENPSERSPVNATFTEVIENELLVGSEEWEGVPGSQPAGSRQRSRRTRSSSVAIPESWSGYCPCSATYCCRPPRTPDT